MEVRLKLNSKKPKRRKVKFLGRKRGTGERKEKEKAERASYRILA